jgi:hypothetical protein
MGITTRATSISVPVAVQRGNCSASRSVVAVFEGISIPLDAF